MRSDANISKCCCFLNWAERTYCITSHKSVKHQLSSGNGSGLFLHGRINSTVSKLWSSPVSFEQLCDNCEILLSIGEAGQSFSGPRTDSFQWKTLFDRCNVCHFWFLSLQIRAPVASAAPIREYFHEIHRLPALCLDNRSNKWRKH